MAWGCGGFIASPPAEDGGAAIPFCAVIRRFLIPLLAPDVVSGATSAHAEWRIGMYRRARLPDSDLPVFFRQERVGKAGKLFMLYKFRSMYTQLQYSLKKPHRGWDDISREKHNSRITPIGRFIRRYKIDELPQLINIAQGNMSFIAYRPELEEKVALNEPGYALLCCHLPGLSCRASIAFINESDMIRQHQLRGEKTPYDTIHLPLKIRISTAYLLKRVRRNNDPAIIFSTIFHSMTGGRWKGSRLPKVEEVPEVPQEWVERYFMDNKV